MAGGGPFISALALGWLDVSVAFLGTVSRDAYGEILTQLLLDAGVDTSLERRSDLPTPPAIVHRTHDRAPSYTFSLAAAPFADFSSHPAPALPETPCAIH